MEQQELRSLVGALLGRHCPVVLRMDSPRHACFGALLSGLFAGRRRGRSAAGWLRLLAAYGLLHSGFPDRRVAAHFAVVGALPVVPAVEVCFLNGAFAADCPSNSDQAWWAWPTFLEVLFTRT